MTNTPAERDTLLQRRCVPFTLAIRKHGQPVSEKTADLVGQNGFAAVPTTALDPHLVQLLPQSRRLKDLGLHGVYNQRPMLSLAYPFFIIQCKPSLG